MKKSSNLFLSKVKNSQANIWLTSLVVILFAVSMVSLQGYKPQAVESDAAFLTNLSSGVQQYSSSGYNSYRAGSSNTGCTYTTPTLTAAPSTSVTPASIPNSTSQTFTVTVTNRDSSGCPPSHFDIVQGVNDPDNKSIINNWNFTDSSPSWLNLAPGTSGQTTVKVDPVNAKARNYNYFVSAYHGNSSTGENYCDFIGNVAIKVTVPAPGGSGTGGGSTTDGVSSGCNTSSADSDQSSATGNQATTCTPQISRPDVVTKFNLDDRDCPLDKKTATNQTPNHSFHINWQVNDAKVTHVLAGSMAGRQSCSVRGSGITGTNGYDSSASNGNSNSINITIPSYQRSAQYVLSCDLSETAAEQEVEVAKICVAEEGAQCGTSFNLGDSGSTQYQSFTPPSTGTQTSDTFYTPPTENKTSSSFSNFLSRFLSGNLINFNIR